jgi:hypothetical protein
MDSTIARSLAEQELAQITRMGYHQLVSHVGGKPITKEIVGPDGKRYQVEVCVFWDSKKGGSIRVIAAVDDGGLRALAPVSTSGIVHPELISR